MSPEEALELAKQQDKPVVTRKSSNPHLTEYHDTIVELKVNKGFSFEMIADFLKNTLSLEKAPGPQSIRNHLVQTGDYEPPKRAPKAEKAEPEQETQEEPETDSGYNQESEY